MSVHECDRQQTAETDRPRYGEMCSYMLALIMPEPNYTAIDSDDDLSGIMKSAKVQREILVGYCRLAQN